MKRLLSHLQNKCFNSSGSSSAGITQEIDFEEPLSECASSVDSALTISTQHMALIDKQIEDTENYVLSPLANQNKSGTLTDLMKYQNYYASLLDSYRDLEEIHKNQLIMLLNGQYVHKKGRRSIETLLDNFALKIGKRKHKFESNKRTKSRELDSHFTAKKWKRRYHSLVDAFDILYKDYQLIHNIYETEPEKFYEIRTDVLDIKIQELVSELALKKSGIFRVDDGIKTSSAFLSDLVSQCRIHKEELEKQLVIKDRVLYVLKKAKDQRARLKNYVNSLKDELRYTVHKLQEFQSSRLTKSNSSNDKGPHQSSNTQTNKDPRILLAKQQRIQELERILKEEEARRKKLHNKLQELIGNIRVYCRIRPHPDCFMRVSSDDKLILSAESLPDKITKSWGSNMKCFIFDKVFGPNASQSDIFDNVVDLITSCVDGFNVCIMAYGQTGSGKTHTMMGPPDDPGVNRRAIRELLRVCNLRKQWSYQLRLSMVEVYNEDVSDLLNPMANSNSKLNNVKIMTNQDDDIILQGLSEHHVETEEDIIKYLELGAKNRKVGSTLMNIHSSRSHLILLLKVDGDNCVHKTTSQGTLTLCDLAGSENITKSGATGERFQEATSINKSLTSLGRVFDSLRRRQKPSYRETKLTFLLKPTLGGDAKCLLFVNVRSEAVNVDESLRALFFGQNAMQISPETFPQKRSEHQNSIKQKLKKTNSGDSITNRLK